MNYKTTGLIIISAFFTLFMISVGTLMFHIAYYAGIGMIVTGFAILAYGFSTRDLISPCEQPMEKKTAI